MRTMKNHCQIHWNHRLPLQLEVPKQVTGKRVPSSPVQEKPPKQDNAIVDLLEQVITIQSRGDKKMIVLEEKRLKVEMEREAQQRKGTLFSNENV